MALPDSHVFFLPVPQQKAGPLAEMDQCQLPSTVRSWMLVMVAAGGARPLQLADQRRLSLCAD
jgi:hypothetical protein